MSWWGSKEPAVDPNIYGTQAKAFENKDFELFIDQCYSTGAEWNSVFEDKEKCVTVWQKVLFRISAPLIFVGW